MTEYVVQQLDRVTIEDGSAIDGMDLMSPFVWREARLLRMLVRAVPNPLGPDDPTGVIASAVSEDGLSFRVNPHLAITPGKGAKEPDAGGCEDPTVDLTPDGHYFVFYTGVDADRSQGCMMLAEGTSMESLVKRQVVIKAPPGEGNIKEATLVRCHDGHWQLYYEYAANNASRIGVAHSNDIEGPWTVMPDPFTIREDSWDNWHLSTGPIIRLPGRDPVMFYNGATVDARWRIGWVSFDRDFTCVTDRCIEPLILPPPAPDRLAADIAFAASNILHGDQIALYYSLADRSLQRALISAFG